MLSLLADHGVMFLRHEKNEGLREGYRGYHKWNIRKICDSSFELWNPNNSHVISADMMKREVAVYEGDSEVMILITNCQEVLDWANKAIQADAFGAADL